MRWSTAQLWLYQVDHLVTNHHSPPHLSFKMLAQSLRQTAPVSSSHTHQVVVGTKLPGTLRKCVCVLEKKKEPGSRLEKDNLGPPKHTASKGPCFFARAYAFSITGLREFEKHGESGSERALSGVAVNTGATTAGIQHPAPTSTKMRRRIWLAGVRAGCKLASDGYTNVRNNGERGACMHNPLAIVLSGRMHTRPSSSRRTCISRSLGRSM